MNAVKSFAKASARERITRVIEGWFLTEPLLFVAWTMHDVVEMPGIDTLRVGGGEIQFNPQFVESLRRDQLQSVLAFEATRILLGHPYSRRQPDPECTYLASNVTVQECLRTKLPIPRPRDLFGDASFDNQYFEFYYRQLSERADETESQAESARPEPEPDNDAGDSPSENSPSENSPPETEPSESDQPENRRTENSQTEDSQTEEEQADQHQRGPGDAGLTDYCAPSQVGEENTSLWHNDDLVREEIANAIRDAARGNQWGSLGGSAKEQILANLRPRLDYRSVLRQFRQSVLSVNRRLTRMKPSRRYGFGHMGSRYDFTTKLLFAVDVSGSMTSDDLRLGFSVVSRFFRYGVESADVVWFDEQLRGGPITLRHARSAFDVTGRGGTQFQPIIDYIDAHRDYDGLIVFTDGYAPVPRSPENTRTRVLWLFKDEATFEQMHRPLKPIGKSAFLKRSAR